MHLKLSPARWWPFCSHFVKIKIWKDQILELLLKTYFGSAFLITLA